MALASESGNDSPQAQPPANPPSEVKANSTGGPSPPEESGNAAIEGYSFRSILLFRSSCLIFTKTFETLVVLLFVNEAEVTYS